MPAGIFSNSRWSDEPKQRINATPFLRKMGLIILGEATAYRGLDRGMTQEKRKGGVGPRPELARRDWAGWIRC